MAEGADADEELVLSIYDRCWEKSKGRYNKWVPGRLTRQELTLYLVMNATARAVEGGLAGLAGDDRFTLEQTAAAFEELGLVREADAVRGLAVLFPGGRDEGTRRERDRLLMEWAGRSADTLYRLNAGFPHRSEQAVIARLAEYVRANPQGFPPGGGQADSSKRI